MIYATLVSTEQLSAHLSDPDWAVIDCRFRLKDLDFGRRSYAESHIAGAIYADLNQDLSGEIVPGVTGRHPLPRADVLTGRLSQMGINAAVQVVAYDDQGGSLAAARLWWMLRWMGHEAVAVLDGGWQAWQKEGRAVRTGVESRPARTFAPHPRPGHLLDANDVLRTLHNPQFRLFDNRTAVRYRGENEPIDPVAGHIPGAVSVPFSENLTEDGHFKSAEELSDKYAALLGNLWAEQTAVYCGSGGSAPHTILAMLHAGLGEAKLYAGSWSDWITDPKRPIHTGEKP